MKSGFLSVLVALGASYGLACTADVAREGESSSFLVACPTACAGTPEDGICSDGTEGVATVSACSERGMRRASGRSIAAKPTIRPHVARPKTAPVVVLRTA